MELCIRRAIPKDAEALRALNESFNGAGLADTAHIERSLRENEREIVCIAYADGEPAGFCCAQVIFSMCYPRPCAEITEMYVIPDYRRAGVARNLIKLTEALCSQYGAEEFRLLTGDDNLPA